MAGLHSAALLALSAALLTSSATAWQHAGQQASEKQPGDFQAEETLIQQGHLNEAKSRTLEELRHHPASIEGYNLLGIIESHQQDYAGALASFQKALKLAPNSTKTHNNLGNLYVAQTKLDLAEKEFRSVLRMEPANKDANYNLGVVLIAKGAPAEAIPHFERVQPQTLETKFNLIRAYLQSKRTADGLRMATRLSEENENDVQVHFTLGLLLASEKQFKPAGVELEKANALHPDTFEILYNIGEVDLRDREYPGAGLALTRALKLKPDSVDALYGLALVYTEELRPLDALDLLVRARKLDGRNADVLFLMARISIDQKYFEDAIPLLEEASQIAPQRTDIRAALGESYFKADKIDKAIDEFKKLSAVEPSVRSYTYLGLSHTYLGRFEEAKQDFQSGLKLDPHDNFCLFHLGYLAERQGDAASAEATFRKVLRADPNYPYALVELASLDIEAKKLGEAAELLKKYVQADPSSASAYYKLAMVERGLHDTAAADKNLAIFQQLSKDAPVKSHPYEHLFDYVDNRSQLAPQAKEQQDMAELVDQASKHPDQPKVLYLLAEGYLKRGKVEEAKTAVAQLDKAAAGDYRTLAGAGVLLARYHLYDDAIQHFRAALQVKPGSDEVNFDLANACFRKGLYSQALEAALQVSAEGQKDDSYLTLLGDIYAHQGNTGKATEIFQSAIARNPDNDQDYLSLALLELRENRVAEAKQTLLKGKARIPGSGRILWGLGLAAALEGNTAEAGKDLERAVEMLPEWPGSYSTLGVFYFQTGQVDKAREVLDRFKNSSSSGGLDVEKIERVLAQSPGSAPTGDQPMTAEQSKQLLQLAQFLADRTL